MSLDYSPEVLRQHEAHKLVRNRLNRIFPITPKAAPIYRYPPKNTEPVDIDPVSAESLWRDWISQKHLVAVHEAIKSEPSINVICAEVMAQFGVRKMDFLSARRRQEFVVPRQIAMAICKHLTLKSLPEIGRRIGGRDHTTIMHGCRKMQPVTDAVAAKLAPDASVFEWVMAMKAEIEITPFARPRQHTRKAVEPA